MMKFSTNIGNDKLCCVRNNQLSPAYVFPSVTQPKKPFIVNIIIYEYILSPKVFFCCCLETVDLQRGWR